MNFSVTELVTQKALFCETPKAWYKAENFVCLHTEVFNWLQHKIIIFGFKITLEEPHILRKVPYYIM